MSGTGAAKTEAAGTRVAKTKTAKAGVLAELRRRIAAIERGSTGGGEIGGAVLALGLAAIDHALPRGGLGLGAVHEAIGSAATGFAAVLAGRARGPVLWCVGEAAADGLYGAGLAAFGCDPARLVVLRCRNAKEMLWAMEEGLRAAAPAMVVAEPASPVGLGASRRLQLAAEAGRTLGLVLRETKGSQTRLAPSAVASRWRVDTAPNGCWRIELLRCRGLSAAGHNWPGKHWMVEWHDATGGLALVAPPGDRPDQAA
ncbi:MAG: damage-inducible mutagenesis protein [Alphaproteobacteria bacterium]|jgi:protein ImuA|nr:damage-inducible mutagenesis protein [Alphaproteobacteria bacterium]